MKTGCGMIREQLSGNDTETQAETRKSQDSAEDPMTHNQDGGA